eukprot:CAMPEP_0113542454 /NCGR_PEP_ID=MMETSP0015_2-20120614/9618_1 /TAXON_ID=2838 /ORGANISM="Odontella" /LENGTH=561 /DNA_ID=CAMNT_0000442517 /DNA_START=82 /DNA_END=1767 /DNA_ORIENTATION=+ /assembly_acc=CAM_ASM_000160
MSTAYEQCAADLGGAGSSDNGGGTIDPVALVKCVSESLEDSNAGMDAFFLIYASSLVFFMQAGFAMLCAGAVRLKNVQNTMLKNFLDACGAALGFYTVGYAFAYGGSEGSSSTTFIGNTNFFLMDVEDHTFWLFQFAFAATAATIVAGTLAERCQMAAYLCYSIALTGFVYPVIVHAVWSDAGFLSPTNANPLWGSGVIDFAGSAVVHTTGGVTAIIATKILGPRKGRFFDARGKPVERPKKIQGHSMALQMLGTFILWFGWYGFNAGSAVKISSAIQGRIASLAAVNTTLAAASGGVTALFTNLIAVERRMGEATFNIVYAMNGCLGGLVAITAGCAVVEPWAAVIAGFFAGVIYVVGSDLLVRFRLDDAVDAIPVHLLNGMWGAIVVGLLASPSRMMDAYETDTHVGWFYSWGRGSADATLLACQVIGLLFVVGWVTAIMFPFFIILNYLGWFRADSLEEMVGLDISYHGGGQLFPGAESAVKPEDIEAFQNRRRELQRVRSENSASITQANASQHFQERGSYHGSPNAFPQGEYADRSTAEPEEPFKEDSPERAAGSG